MGGGAMKLEEFKDLIRNRVIYETIYDDTEGRQIIVVGMLPLYSFVSRLLEEHAVTQTLSK